MINRFTIDALQREREVSITGHCCECTHRLIRPDGSRSLYCAKNKMTLPCEQLCEDYMRDKNAIA